MSDFILSALFIGFDSIVYIGAREILKSTCFIKEAGCQFDLKGQNEVVKGPHMVHGPPVE